MTDLKPCPDDRHEFGPLERLPRELLGKRCRKCDAATIGTVDDWFTSLSATGDEKSDGKAMAKKVNAGYDKRGHIFDHEDPLGETTPGRVAELVLERKAARAGAASAHDGSMREHRKRHPVRRPARDHNASPACTRQAETGRYLPLLLLDQERRGGALANQSTAKSQHFS
jgi:hypothetical protein